jgi:hypothetical protein
MVQKSTAKVDIFEKGVKVRQIEYGYQNGYITEEWYGKTGLVFMRRNYFLNDDAKKDPGVIEGKIKPEMYHIHSVQLFDEIGKLKAEWSFWDTGKLTSITERKPGMKWKKWPFGPGTIRMFNQEGFLTDIWQYNDNQDISGKEKFDPAKKIPGPAVDQKFLVPLVFAAPPKKLLHGDLDQYGGF